MYSFLQTDVLGHDVFSSSPQSPPASPDKSRAQWTAASGSKTTLMILTSTAVIASFAALGSNATIALGLSYAIITALAFLLVEKARAEAASGRTIGGSVIYSANGLFSHTSQATPGSSGDSKMAVIRDVAGASASCAGIAALTLESFTFGGLGYWGIFGQVPGDQWVFWDGILGVVYAIVTIVVHVVVYGTILLLVSDTLLAVLLQQF